jgi:hypothetical protein
MEGDAMRRVVFSAGLAALVLGLTILCSSAASLAGHDGHWSVLVVTEKGECDRAYRDEVTIAEGQLQFSGEPGISIAGTVAGNGAVKVSISGGSSRNAQGTGRLSVASGAGTWHGSGSTGLCTGRWEAERRG